MSYPPCATSYPALPHTSTRPCLRWGNALPTAVWLTAIDYLKNDLGFEDCGHLNHTQGAVTARDEDEARVNSFCDQLHSKYLAFQIPHFGPRCPP